MVPQAEPKYMVVDANAYSQLRQIDRFSEYQTAGDAGLRALIDGTFGKIEGLLHFPFAVRFEDNECNDERR